MLEAVVGALVWAIANGVYIDMKRKGVRGFGRLCAFWMGFPSTWVWLILIAEGAGPRLAVPLDDEEALLAEIRRDRALRTGDGSGTAEEARADK